MNFHFALADLDGIAPWTIPSQNNRKHLSWFGLTDGSYWIEVQGHQLLRYSNAVCQHWANTWPESFDDPYVDYYVVRLWEDIWEMLPVVLDPVPDDLVRLIASDGPWATWGGLEDWIERTQSSLADEDENAWDSLYIAKNWWGQRQLDSGYLRAGFGLWFWRVGDEVHIRWDNTNVLLDGIPVWSDNCGECTVSVPEFVEAVRSFNAGFLAAMDERVTQVRAHWDRPDVDIDVDGLEREQRERSTWFESVLNTMYNSQWDQVRAALMRFEEPRE